MPASNDISIRAKLARWGLRRFIKRRAHRQTLSESRRQFAAMEWLIPAPPRRVSIASVIAGGVNGEWIVTPRSKSDRYVLYFHGGAYRVGSPRVYRHFTWRLAAAARAQLMAVAYRLAPEHPYPAALEDAAAAYEWLLERAEDSGRIGIVGDSAGGGLALALLLKLRDDKAPLPGAAVALSPWTDLALTGRSLTINAETDVMLNASDLPVFAADVLAGTDPHNPYASPVYGDCTGLPPTLIHVGSDEILRDDAERMAARMRAAKCHVELAVWPRMPHVWHSLAPFLPEANDAITQIQNFLDRVLDAGRIRQRES